MTGTKCSAVALARVVTAPDQGVAYLLVDGKDVFAIDAKGAHLKACTPVRSLFVEREDLQDLSPLGVADGFAASLGGLPCGSQEFVVENGTVTRLSR